MCTHFINEHRLAGIKLVGQAAELPPLFFGARLGEKTLFFRGKSSSGKARPSVA